LNYLIISSGRSDKVLTYNLLKCKIVIREEEYKDYSKNYPKSDLVVVDNDINTLPKIRNFCKEEFAPCYIFDDDVVRLLCFDGVKSHINIDTRKDIYAILENVYGMACDINAKLFGLNKTSDIRLYKFYKPFSFYAWFSGVIGVDKSNIWWDEDLLLKTDIDFSIQNVIMYGKVFCDNRFSFRHKQNTSGGNAKYRNYKQIQLEIEKYKQRYGDAVRFIQKGDVYKAGVDFRKIVKYF